jgi:hypothetical protein
MLAKHDLDKLIASVSAVSLCLSDLRLRLPQFIACDPQIPAKSSTPIITRITQMLQLRNIVRNLPDLQHSLSSTSSTLLQIIFVVSLAHNSYSSIPTAREDDQRQTNRGHRVVDSQQPQ